MKRELIGISDGSALRINKRKASKMPELGPERLGDDVM